MSTRPRPKNYNELKRRVLATFAERGALRPPELAIHVGFKPARSTYSYCKTLFRYRLLERTFHGPRGLVAYRLTARGHKRLLWLQAQILARR